MSMQAVVSPGNGKDAEVQTISIPEIKPSEVLVKTHAVALNPTDWKHMRYISPKGAIMGCDFSGSVTKVGSEVKHLKEGDRVATMAHGSFFESGDTGAFAEYLKIESVPDGTSYEEAASIGGVGAETAAFALYYTLKKDLPGKGSSGDILLVWSGATSVGSYAIQFGKASGLRVVTTSSPENFDYLKSLGAEAVFNYKDADVAEQIKKWASGAPINAALDCISEKGTTKTAANAMTGGTIVTLLPVDAEKEGITNVKVEGILLYTTAGYKFTFRGTDLPAMPDHKAFRENFNKNVMSSVIANGQLKANKIRELSGGLEAIIEGMKYHEAGKVKGEKQVYSFGKQ